jgi:putative RNA 2'-phosphotransferase
MDDLKLSRVISHALRHEPWLYELELDEGGWVSIESLLEALRPLEPSWGLLGEFDIEQMIARSAKTRHEIRDGRIRAVYGHSMPQKLLREVAEPPEFLFHGTALAAAETILQDGLKPMGRQFVHLSRDPQTAEQVARRKSGVPVVLRVAAKDGFADGLLFYRGDDVVWLADGIPPRFITRA